MIGHMLVALAWWGVGWWALAEVLDERNEHR
jgi:hypothetical protein